MSFGAVRRTPADAASGGVGTAQLALSGRWCWVVLRWRGRSLQGGDGAVKTGEREGV